MSAGLRMGRKQRGKRERGKGRRERKGEKGGRKKWREGGREGVGKGRDKSNCLAVASRSNHWNLSELPPNEDWAYCVFAPIYLIVALTMMEFVP